MPPDQGGRFGAPDELRRAGAAADRRQEAPEPLTLEWLRDRCSTMERVLRMQPEYEDGLPHGWDEELEKYPPTSMRNALRRYGLLQHCYRVRDRDLRPAPDEERMEAMLDLLRREPVTVELPGRQVKVTARSYLALYEIARHAVRVQALERDLSRIRELRERALERAREGGEGDGRPTGHLRRRLQTLEELSEAKLAEVTLHRRAMYAHVATEDGAPADGPEDAPEWADEVGPLADLVLLDAVREVGYGRLEALGDQPKHPDRPDSEPLEDWGWIGWLVPLRDIDRKIPVDPAEPLRRDFFQQVAAKRADSPSVTKDGGPRGEP